VLFYKTLNVLGVRADLSYRELEPGLRQALADGRAIARSSANPPATTTSGTEPACDLPPQLPGSLATRVRR
jgi:hypothetical protein